MDRKPLTMHERGAVAAVLAAPELLDSPYL
jgi:hypothetical protein